MQLHKWGEFTVIIINIIVITILSLFQVKHGKAVYTWKAGHKEEFVYEKVLLVTITIIIIKTTF